MQVGVEVVSGRTVHGMVDQTGERRMAVGDAVRQAVEEALMLADALVDGVVEGLSDGGQVLLLLRGGRGGGLALGQLIDLAGVEPEQLIVAADVDGDLRCLRTGGDSRIDRHLDHRLATHRAGAGAGLGLGR